MQLFLQYFTWRLFTAQHASADFEEHSTERYGFRDILWTFGHFAGHNAAGTGLS